MGISTKGLALKRTMDSKVWVRGFIGYSSKRKAQAAAERKRGRGRCARVVQVRGMYVVYERKK